MLTWFASNWGNVLKGAALAVAGFSFFVNLKVDVAVTQADVAAIRSDVSDVNSKVDRIYDFVFRNVASAR